MELRVIDKWVDTDNKMSVLFCVLLMEKVLVIFTVLFIWKCNYGYRLTDNARST